MSRDIRRIHAFYDRLEEIMESLEKVDKKKELTCTEAVHIVMRRWLPGVQKIGDEISGEVQVVLDNAGVGIKPMQTTIMRRMRECADFYGVKHVYGNKSEYIKEVKNGNVLSFPSISNMNKQQTLGEF